MLFKGRNVVYISEYRVQVRILRDCADLFFNPRHRHEVLNQSDGYSILSLKSGFWVEMSPICTQMSGSKGGPI